MLALDLDGTLLSSDRTLPARNIDAVRRAASTGVHVVLASGRNAPSVGRFAAELGLDGPRVCCNGAHVLLDAKRELCHTALDAELCRDVLSHAARNGLHVHLYCRDRLVFVSDDAWGHLYLSRVGGVERELLGDGELESLEVTKLMIVADPASIEREFARFSADASLRGAHLTLSEPEYLEFLPRESNKGKGLRALAKALGIAREETAAIGDYLNDREMLEWVGVSAAVANAHSEIKSLVQFVLDSNDSCGVASFIDSHLSNRQE